jgi:long-chain acyl-CoA synthetase
MLRRSAARQPRKVAIIDGNRRLTYRQFDEYTDRFAAALASIGVARGDRVGILAPNCIDFEVAFYGVAKSGAVATTVNSAYREREIAHQLNVSGAEVLIVYRSQLQTAESAREALPSLKRFIVIQDTSDDPASFWGMIERAPALAPSVALDPKEDLAILPFSSGTTGLPKGTMLTHFNITANLRQFFDQPGEDALMFQDDVILVHLPLFHIYAITLMNGAIRVGATQVIMDRFDMDLFLTLLSEHRATHLYTVPPVGLALTQYPGVSNFDLSSLRVGVFAAAPLTTDMQTKLADSLGFPVIQVYGMTELSPVANADFMDPERIRPGSSGPAVADTEEKVVDVQTGTKELPPGEVGELLVRGPQVMKGYFDSPEATAETITKDGWCHTGDIVRLDQDGYIWVLDRKKELIKYKGFQVAPAELEGLLLEHPAIMDVAVIGKADLEAGEIPKAFVVRKPGADVSAAAVMGFVTGKVATFKLIRDVEFVDAIPKSPSGKILRRMLIDQERARQA